MFCYRVTEGVSLGFEVPISVLVSGIFIGAALSIPLLLEEALPRPSADELEALDALGVRHVRLTKADVTWDDEKVVLGRPPKRVDRQALVWFQTHAGHRGKVFLTSRVRDETLKRGRVEPEFRPFPPVGVTLVASQHTPEELYAGVEGLNVLAMMQPGASVRIFRTGQLEGAAPWMAVHWHGDRLKTTVPPRFQDAHP